MTPPQTLRFEDWESEKMRDPQFRAAAQALEPAYQVTRLRLQKGLTQKELAKAVGTRQSSIARLESGKSQPSLSFLHKVVEALGGRLQVHIVAENEVISLCQEGASVQSHATASADKVTIADSSVVGPVWRDRAAAPA
jgi:transcriptional regulator with XRE-family HTH domain